MISLEDKKAIATKALYAAVGAPVVAIRLLTEYSDKMMEKGTQLTGAAKSQFDTLAEEGEKFATGLRDSDVVEDIQEFVSVDQIQDTVGKLREQLESALSNWRESFTPEVAAKPAPGKPGAKKTASKPAAKKTAAKPAAKKTAAKPAAKKTAAKPAAKKTAAKPAAKKTASK
jgi:hypothetical protein